MPIYDIAGLKVRIENAFGRTEKQAIPYLAENQAKSQFVNLAINISPERLKKAITMYPGLDESDWYYKLSASDFHHAIIHFNGFMLHSSCVVVDNVAYAFSADSGVGKSTHTKLWLKHFGSRAYILNDDTPCIRIIDGKIYACGAPWSGSNDCSTPAIVPLGGICFIERSKENKIEKLKTSDAIFNIFSQTRKMLKSEKMDMLLDTVETVVKNVGIYNLKCNISDDAVMIAYNKMKKDKNELNG